MKPPVDKSELARRFVKIYGHPPAVIVRSPGRVNLIGEHTDYSLLPVLPAAIEKATYVAAAPTRDSQVVGRSRAFSKEETTPLSRGALRTTQPSGWQRYLFGALTELEDVQPGLGAELLIDSDLPLASGLSSSSSLTIGLLVAFDEIWRAGLDREQIYRRAIVAERHVGVEGGGMDQAVILFAERDAALRIDFSPPGRRPVPLPDGMTLLVANSGESARKGGEARRHYNERVVACRLGAALLGLALDIVDAPAPTFGQLAQRSGLPIGRLLTMTAALPQQANAVEVGQALDVDPAQLVRLTAGALGVDLALDVQCTARHVLSEAKRVEEAEAALRSGDAPAFGRLLDASHQSLATDYRCSTAALDRLCQAMREAGAYGARLTGAGFGGYAMAAIPTENLDKVISAAVDANGGPAFAVRPSGPATCIDG